MFSKYLRLLVAGIIAASALSLSGCAATGAIQAGTELSIGEMQGLDSLNPDVATTLRAQTPNSDLGQLTTVGFYNFDASGDLVANTLFGKAKVVSQLPFTVAYTINGSATWSDGTRVDATDLLLSWLAASNSEKYGFHSIRANSGLRFATSIPRLSTDLNTLTVQFTRPVSDWRTSIYPAVAAHTLAQKAFPTANLDARAAKSRFVQAVNTSNHSDLGKLALNYVAAYSLSNGAHPSSRFLVGAGPYLVASADAVSGVKLVANAKFSWGKPPRIETVNVRYYEDSIAMIADISIGKLDLAATEESGSAQTQQISGVAKKAGLQVALGLSQNIDSIQLNLRQGSIFAGAKAGVSAADATRATALRQAFLLSVPKQRIVAAINSDYSVQNAKSFFYAPDSIGYRSTVSQNHSSSYSFQDLETASEIMKSAGVSGEVNVRVLFDSANPRQQIVWAELSKYAKQIGFNLVNLGVTDPSSHITAGDYDVAILQQPLFSSTSFAGVETVVTDLFDSPSFDDLAKKLAVAKKLSNQQALVAKLDSTLFAQGYGLPLYQVPTMVAFGKGVSGVSLSPLGNSAVWGYWNWQKAAK